MVLYHGRPGARRNPIALSCVDLDHALDVTRAVAIETGRVTRPGPGGSGVSGMSAATDATNAITAAALDLASQGLPVFPCNAKDKSPLVSADSMPPLAILPSSVRGSDAGRMPTGSGADRRGQRHRCR